MTFAVPRGLDEREVSLMKYFTVHCQVPRGSLECAVHCTYTVQATWVRTCRIHGDFGRWDAIGSRELSVWYTPSSIRFYEYRFRAEQAGLLERIAMRRRQCTSPESESTHFTPPPQSGVSRRLTALKVYTTRHCRGLIIRSQVQVGRTPWGPPGQ